MNVDDISLLFGASWNKEANVFDYMSSKFPLL